MNLEDVESGILDVYREVTGNAVSDDTLQVPLDSIGLDSLDVIDFVYHIEDKFNVRLQFEDNMLKKINMHELCLIVKQKLAS